MLRRHARFAAALSIAYAAAAAGGTVDPGPEHLWVGYAANCTHNDIQDAIDAASPTRGAIIHIVGFSWTGIGLVVQDKDIALSGGHAACLDYGVSGLTTLSNTPHRGLQGSPVLGVYGTANVSASRIEFINGGQGNDTQDGGGIQFEATGTLTLGNVVVRDNVAVNGGGIAMRSGAGPSTLRLLANTRIADNEASDDGGGIHLANRTTLRVDSPDVSIADNEAMWGGGGIAVTGGAHAAMGSYGTSGAALLEGNTAQWGGGIAVYGENALGASSLRLFSIDARRQTTLRHNLALHDGGALYVGAAALPEGADGVRVCVSHTRIESNQANDGAIAYAETPAASRGGEPLVLHPPLVQLGATLDAEDCPGPNPVAYGAVACAQGTPCNRYRSNIAEEFFPIRGEPTRRGGAPQFPGSLLTAQRGAILLVDDAVIEYGRATAALLAARHEGILRVRGSVVAGNVSDLGHVLEATFGGQSGLLQSTVADNEGVGAALYNDGAIGLFNTIVDSGEAPLYEQTNSAMFVEMEQVLAGNFDGVPTEAMVGSVVGLARFVDRTTGNYRLANDSLAIDFAPLQPGTDLDGTPRTHDAPRANRLGPTDVGAFEWTPEFLPGRLFSDGLESEA